MNAAGSATNATRIDLGRRRVEEVPAGALAAEFAKVWSDVERWGIRWLALG